MSASAHGHAMLLGPFTIPGFAGLWVSSSLASFGRIISQLALSWLTLEMTGSPFLVGVVGASRMVPQLLVGIPAGALADWVDRRTLMVVVNGLGAAGFLALVGLASADLLSFPLLVAASLAYGALDTARMAGTQAYAYDLVRTSRASSGMALNNLGVQIMATLAGLAGGYVQDHFGAAVTFGLVAAALLGASLAPALLPHGVSNREADGTLAASPTARRRRTSPDFGRATTLLARTPLLAALVFCILLVEIFGFATQTLFPIFARDIFAVGATGLGVITAVRSAGGALGLLLVSRLGTEGRTGLVFAVTGLLFGLAILLLALTPLYGVALLLLVLYGASAAVMDTLGQTLIQSNAPEDERGAAMGLWVFSVGFGPFGHLALGAAAAEIGAPLAQVVSGTLLLLVGTSMLLYRPLRLAR